MGKEKERERDRERVWGRRGMSVIEFLERVRNKYERESESEVIFYTEG